MRIKGKGTLSVNGVVLVEGAEIEVKADASELACRVAEAELASCRPIGISCTLEPPARREAVGI